MARPGTGRRAALALSLAAAVGLAGLGLRGSTSRAQSAPPGAPTTAIGVTINGRAAYEAGTGVQMDYIRTYNENDAKAANAAGRAVVASTKMNMTTPGAARDAELRRLALVYAGFSKPGFFSVYHEPEDNINGGEFTEAQYIQAEQDVNRVMGPILRPLGWKMMQIFMGWNFPGGGGNRPIAGLILPTTEALGADIYMWRGANAACNGGSGPPLYACSTSAPVNNAAQLYSPALNYATQIGKPVYLAEFGVSRRQADTTGAERTQMLSYFVQWMNSRPLNSRYAGVLYFESNRIVDWRIAGEPASLAQFKLLRVAGTTPTPTPTPSVTPTPTPTPSPGPTPAEQIAALQAQVAALQIQLSAETAANAVLVGDLANANAQVALLQARITALQVIIDAVRAALGGP